MFRWTALAIATFFAVAVLWMLNDLRLDLRRSTTALHDHLPQILERTQRTSETLADLAADIRQLRDLLGSNQPRDKSLVAYADAILDRIQASGAKIGLDRLVGKGITDERPAGEWVVGARKEAIWLTLTGRSRHDVLEGLTRNRFGRDWYIHPPDAEPVKLVDWIRRSVPEYRDE